MDALSGDVTGQVDLEVGGGLGHGDVANVGDTVIKFGLVWTEGLQR